MERLSLKVGNCLKLIIERTLHERRTNRKCKKKKKKEHEKSQIKNGWYDSVCFYFIINVFTFYLCNSVMHSERRKKHQRKHIKNIVKTNIVRNNFQRNVNQKYSIQNNRATVFMRKFMDRMLIIRVYSLFLCKNQNCRTHVICKIR